MCSTSRQIFTYRNHAIGSHHAATIPARGKMTNMGDIVELLKKERDRLTNQLQAISGALSAFGSTYASGNAARRKLSAAGKARIAAAQRARWAKLKAKTGQHNVVSMPKKRTMSASARRKIAAAQRARWAKVKSEKKTA
jgi:hypothetical protein